MIRLQSLQVYVSLSLDPGNKIKMPLQAQGIGLRDWRVAIRAGIAYTLGVFMFAFVIGAVRVTLLVPRLGELPAVLLEAPVVLTVSWWISIWCCRRFKLSLEPHTRALMGIVAFATLMLVELGVAVWVFGESLDLYFAKFTKTAGVVGLVMQVCFAAIPWLQARSTSVK